MDQLKPAKEGGETASSSRESQSEDEFALLFSQSSDMLSIAGADGYFKRLNPAWTTCLGWTLEQLQAEPFLNFIHPDDVEATLWQIDRRNQGAEVVMFENRYRHRDGSYRWLRWNAQPVLKNQLIYATARDVTKQKRLEREILEIADQEKERLGRELHDGLCQTLAGIAALSTTLSKKLAASSEYAASAAAVEINELLNEAIGEARDLAHGLGRVSSHEAGLDVRLKTLALNVQHRYRVSCTLECGGPFPRLPQNIESHLFRIAQEAVNNALTHGKGDRIIISLDSKNGKGALGIRCNGKGIPGEMANSAGMGMHTMDYRAHLIGGSLEVRPRTLRGMVVTCVFPVPPAPNSTETPEHSGENK